ncbi:MAG: hypothetical protein AAFP08_12395 [Bacteroidota bacterium]
MQRNREVAAGYRVSIVNFLRLCKRLGRLRERVDYLSSQDFDKRLTKLRTQITSTDQLFDRQWLLDSLPAK